MERRVFCTATEVSPLCAVFEYAESQGITLCIDELNGPIDVRSPDWSEALISYKAGKNPLVVECNRDDETQDCLACVEPQEYIEEIGPPGLSLTNRRVIKHLKHTKFIIASQLLNDIDDDGYDANSTFLNYFVKHCGGIVHADREGFYGGDKVILKVD